LGLYVEKKSDGEESMSRRKKHVPGVQACSTAVIQDPRKKTDPAPRRAVPRRRPERSGKKIDQRHGATP